MIACARFLETLHETEEKADLVTAISDNFYLPLNQNPVKCEIFTLLVDS